MCVGPLARCSGIPGIECDHTFLRWQQLSQSKISSDSHVNSRLQSTLTRAPSNRSQSRTNQSLASRLSKNAASSTSDFGHKRTFRRLRRTSALPPKSGHWNSAARCPLCAKSGHMQCSNSDSYSMTSSATASGLGGMVRPSALAVLRLMTRSNLVGA